MLSLILDNHSTVRLLLFLLAVVLFGTWEIVRPQRELAYSKLLRWTNNWLLSVLNSILLSLVFPVLAVGVAVLAQDRGWGLFNNLDLHPAISIVLFILLFDLAIYWQHRFYHIVPVLWRLHRVHHADPDYDISTGIRFHPISIFLSMLIKMALIIAMGPLPLAVLFAEIILNVTAMFNHSNIRLPSKVDTLLRHFLVTPDMHRVHHSVTPEETNSNFGFNFPWWDRLFGSYREQPAGGQVDMEIGIRGFQNRESQILHKLLLHPWLKGEPTEPDKAKLP